MTYDELKKLDTNGLIKRRIELQEQEDAIANEWQKMLSEALRSNRQELDLIRSMLGLKIPT